MVKISNVIHFLYENIKIDFQSQLTLKLALDLKSKTIRLQAIIRIFQKQKQIAAIIVNSKCHRHLHYLEFPLGFVDHPGQIVVLCGIMLIKGDLCGHVALRAQLPHLVLDLGHHVHIL